MRLLLLSFFCFLLQTGMAQRGRTNPFNAGAFVGLNFAQIEGDNQQGFDKTGLNLGIRGSARLIERLDYVMELTFSQRGSKSKSNVSSPVFSPNLDQFKIGLNYWEAAFLLDHRASVKQEEDFVRYPVHIFAGFSYGRLIQTKVDERIYSQPGEDQVVYSEIKDDFKKNDISVIFGGAYYPSPNWGISLRLQVSAVPLFSKEDFDQIAPESLIPYHLNINLFYILRKDVTENKRKRRKRRRRR